MHSWHKTIDINENKARQLIASQHHLKIDSISLLDEGWDNSVYLVNSKLIFRFPHRDAGVNCMESEIGLLPFIAKHVSFPLSKPEWIGKPSSLYPYPFAGYTKLQGIPLCDATESLIHDVTFARSLASWLKELHAIPATDKYAVLVKGEHTWRLNIPHRIGRCESNISRYEHYFSQAGFDKKLLLEMTTLLSQFKFANIRRSYLHGDLYFRHVIVDPNSLSPAGLIDWGDVHVGHPGIDLAVGMIFTEEGLKFFLDTYENIDEETIYIMLFHSFCHMISFLPYAYEQNKKTLKIWAFMALSRAIEEIKKLK